MIRQRSRIFALVVLFLISLLLGACLLSWLWSDDVVQPSFDDAYVVRSLKFSIPPAFAEHSGRNSAIDLKAHIPFWTAIRRYSSSNRFRRLGEDSSDTFRRVAGSYDSAPDGVFLGQQGEDRLFCTHYFHDFTEGTYLEIGTMDSTSYSNTHALDKWFNWSGILVAGDPAGAALLKTKRPNAASFNFLPCHEMQYLHYPVDPPNPSSSGIIEYMDPALGLQLYPTHWAEWGKGNWTGAAELLCMGLDYAFDVVGLRHVNFLSFDIADAALQVLKAIDWSRVSFDAICAKMLGINPGKEQAVIDFLCGKGFIVSQIVNHNVWLLRPGFVPHKKTI